MPTPSGPYLPLVTGPSGSGIMADWILCAGTLFHPSAQRRGFAGERVTSLFEDHAGRLWVGLDNGLFVYEHGRFTPIHRADGGPIGIVLAMAEDIDQNVWASVIRNPAGRPTRLVCFRDGRFIKEISDLGLDVVSLKPIPTAVCGWAWLKVAWLDIETIECKRLPSRTQKRELVRYWQIRTVRCWRQPTSAWWSNAENPSIP